MTKIVDFHSGKVKFVKGKLRKERKLDGFDFAQDESHTINTNWLKSQEEYIKQIEEKEKIVEQKKTNDMIEIFKSGRQPKFNNETMRKHLKKYKQRKIRRNYVGVTKQFYDDPILFRKYILWRLGEL